MDEVDKIIARAKQGDAEAEYDIGRMYAIGEVLNKNGQKAAKWYRKSGEQGHAKAQFNLGMMYRNGEAVEKDEQTAFMWYKKRQSKVMHRRKVSCLYV